MKNIENMNALEIESVINVLRERIEILENKVDFLNSKELHLLNERNRAFIENREENTSIFESYEIAQSGIIDDVKSIARFLREVTE